VVFEQFPRTPSLKVIKRDIVEEIARRSELVLQDSKT
jgi:hypothetical protein